MDPRRDFDREENQPFPGRGPNQGPYKFTQEEIRVIKECNRESFFQRCLPLGGLLGFATYYGVQSGYLRPNQRFGATPKVIVAVIIGYFMGKVSYQSKCADKLMQLPNSQIGEMLRQRRKGNFQESLEPGFGPGMSLAPFSNINPSDTYSDLGPQHDLDSNNRPQYDGLDDSHRPSVDNEIYDEEMPPVQKHVTTYEELRKKNREEYQQKRTAIYRDVPPRSPPPPPSTRPATDSIGPGSHKTKYGDDME